MTVDSYHCHASTTGVAGFLMGAGINISKQLQKSNTVDYGQFKAKVWKKVYVKCNLRI